MKTRTIQFLQAVRLSGAPLQRRFMLYVASAATTSLLLLLLLLNLFGILNPMDGRIEVYLNNQLDHHAAQMTHDLDRLAACAVSFSSELEAVVEQELDRQGLTFPELAGRIDALTALQTEAYSTVYTNLRLASCSGAFYILDTTVAPAADTPLYSGLYLKFANLYADSTINTAVALFRGAAEVARSEGINLSSAWQNEMQTDAFDHTDVFAGADYLVSPVAALPDTWERARYLCAPIRDRDGRVIGICGFELSDLYLRLAYRAADTESDQTICALLDEIKGGYAGQFISNRSGYPPPICTLVTAKQNGRFVEYQCGEERYIGKTAVITLENSGLTLAAMLPAEQYAAIVHTGRTKTVTVFTLATAVAFLFCRWLGRRYIAPIRAGLAQLQTGRCDYAPSGIPEIDDLFAFLAEQDRRTETALAELAQQNAQMQTDLERLSREQIAARQELSRLSYSRKGEVDPEDYAQFLQGVKTLTPTERSVFEHYLAGRSVKEIIELTGVKESTVRFHNRNIYSKLGVKSLKQLLLFASLMTREDLPTDAE